MQNSKKDYEPKIMFKKIFEERMDLIRSILGSKEKEYAQGKNRYHNFDKAAARRGRSDVEALSGMKAKHSVSVDDMVEEIERCFKKGLPAPKFSKEIIREKIGDDINYAILLEGMLLERYCDDYEK